MAGNRSFKNYISVRFDDEFCSHIEKYMEENQDNLDLDIQNIHKIGEINLTNIDVKMASINDLPGMDIEFDVVWIEFSHFVKKQLVKLKISAK